MDYEEAQPHDDPYDDRQLVEESVRNIPRREASGRGIDSLELTIEGKTHDTKTGMHSYKLKDRRKRYRLTNDISQQSTHFSPR